AFRAAIELAEDSPAGKQAKSQLYELLHLSVGQPAPSFSAAAIGGRRISPANYRGKPLLLVFWGTYWTQCVAEVPLLKELYGKYQERGFAIASILNLKPENYL